MQVLLTFVVAYMLSRHRIRAGIRGEMPDQVALREPNWPPHVRQVENNYLNQFELPVLFYLLTILAIITRHADLFFVLMAWVFVVLRIFHAYVHVTSNDHEDTRTAVLRRPGCADDHVGGVHRPDHARPAMTPAARLSAAIEVLADIELRRRPASDALKDWGLSHRFAGSGDRAGIAGLVYDALRRRASSAHVMGEATPRAILLGMLKLERGFDRDTIARLFDGSRFAPEPLTETEAAALESASLAGAPPYVAGDYPEWLDPHFARVFGDERAEEGAALASRAPVDLRVNTLKANRDDAVRALADLKAEPTRWSPVGLRIKLDAGAKSPAIHAEHAFIKGLIEIQDEGSQLAALLAGAKPGEQVVDLCAGARRQDLGAGGRDGEPRTDLRHRYRQAPPRADP